MIRNALAIFARTGRIYVGWARTLLPLAFVVFVPLGLIHAIPVHADLTAFDLDGGLKVVALAAPCSRSPPRG